MKNSEYWKQRFEQLEAAQNKKGVDALAEIEQQYRQAQKQLEGQIARWYQRFADNNGISIAQARQYLKDSDLEEFKWDVWDYIKHGEENAIDGQWMKQLENASAKYHISKLEALKIQTQQSMETLFAKQLGTVSKTMGDVFQSGYYHTAYELQNGFKIGWDIAGLDQSQIEKVISKPWAVDGKNFSERIWQNKQKLISEVHNELTQNIMLGADPQKAIDSLAKKMGTSKSNAGRLVMTEEAYFSSAAQKDCFEELGVEQYEIVATLDSHTSEICRSLDGKHFPMKDFQAGVTAPPFHVYCRSTTVPYFEDDFGVIGERAARDEETGKTYYIPGDMTYQQWKETFVDGGDKSELTAKANAAYEDITGNWYPKANPNSHPVVDLHAYTVNGITYTVDGHSVVLDYSPHEKEIAELLKRKVGGENFMVPRVNNPQGISTPDYLFHGKSYDLKTIGASAGENTIYNRVKKAKGQTRRFIIDVTQSGLDDVIINKQIEKMFSRLDTDWVEEVIIIHGVAIVRVVKRV